MQYATAVVIVAVFSVSRDGRASVIQHGSILFSRLSGPGQNYHFLFRVLCERFRSTLQNLTLCLIIYRAQFIFNCRHTNPGKKSSVFLDSFFIVSACHYSATERSVHKCRCSLG